MMSEWRVASSVLAVLATLTACNGPTENPAVLPGDPGEEPIVVKSTAKLCRSLDGELKGRVEACMAEMKAAPMTLSKAAAKAIADQIKGQKGDDKGLLTLAPMVGFENAYVGDRADILGTLLGKSERKASKLLLGEETRTLVVPRDLTAAVDNDNVVLAKLAHHSHLELFELKFAGKDVFVYQVRKSFGISEKTGSLMLDGLRARLEGKPVPKQTWNPSGVRLIGTMRIQGRTLAMRHAVGGNLENVLSDLAARLRRRWEREVEPMGVGSLEERMKDVRLEVHVVVERAPVEARDRGAIFELFEMGIDGAMFQHGAKTRTKDRKFTYMPGSELMTNSWKNVDKMLREMTKQGGWNDRRPWEDASTELTLIRTEHFVERERGGGTGGVKLMRAAPMVDMESMTDEKIRSMLVNGGEWWLHNLREDDSFEYKYWPAQNRRSDDYNEVRHILGTRDLADVWRYRNDDRYLKGSKRSMDWLMKYAVYADRPLEDGTGLPQPPPKSMLFRYPSAAERNSGKTKKEPNQKLGTVAVAILGWVAYADASGDKRFDADIRKMAEYVKSQQTPEGKFEAYNVPSSHSYYGNKNDIVPGEAALALGMVAEYFDEPEWLDFYPKFLDFYTPWFRSRAAKKNPYGRWPHNTYSNLDRLDLVQFGPWSVMASKQYYRLTQDTRAADFGLEVSDWMIDNYQWSEERSPWPDYVGGYYKMKTELPAMQTFCYSEGTAAAYLIASKYRPNDKKYETSTHEAIRFLDVMQYDMLDSYYVSNPRKVFGGVKYTMNENKVRTDYVGHGLSTLSQFLDARDYDPARTLTVSDPKVLDPVERIPGVPEAGAVTDLATP